MRIFLSHQSALAVLRTRGTVADPGIVPCGLTSLDGATASRAALVATGLGTGEGAPLHLAVARARDRARSQAISSHVWRLAVPRGSIMQVASGVYLCGPEMCLLQLAPLLTRPAVAALASELCAGYALSPDGVGGVVRRNPLTSVSRIGFFLESVAPRDGRSPRGAVMVRRALRHVVSGAWSPMERNLALLLSLPPDQGGFGLPRPQLNAWIPLAPEGMLLAGSAGVHVDISWPGERVVVEYDGDQAHANSREADTARQLALEATGYRVVRVSSEGYGDPARMEAVAGVVARELGARPPGHETATRRQRGELARALLRDIP